MMMIVIATKIKDNCTHVSNSNGQDLMIFFFGHLKLGLDSTVICIAVIVILHNVHDCLEGILSRFLNFSRQKPEQY